MAAENPIPDEIDITLTPRACEPLSTGRKGWDGVNLKFTRNTGLAALKGMIERKVKEIVPFTMKNNEKVYYFKNDSNRNTDGLPVKMWTYTDGLYLKPKADSTQRNFELISNDEELESRLSASWANSFKGAGKTHRRRIQEEYDAELEASRNDPNLQEPAQPIPFHFNFFVYLAPIASNPAQHRATQDRMDRAAAAIDEQIANGTFDDGPARPLGQGERHHTMQHYARGTMDQPPRRLHSNTARQLSRLDEVSARQVANFRERYPDGASWTSIKVFLLGRVVDLPVEISSLREALGLPHIDLRLVPEGPATIDREDVVPAGIDQMEDDDHAIYNDMAEN